MVFDAPSDFIVMAEAKGRPLRLKVDPGAPWFVLLNGSVAKSLRLVGTKSATLAIGPVKLKGKTRTQKFTIGGVAATRPVMWLTGEAVRGADGVINPANLPWDRVTMRLRDPRAGEVTVELPTLFDRERGLYYKYSFAGQSILTRFTLADTLTTATGAAAAVFAKRQSGLWDGNTFMHPVRYGVMRPVRRMALAQPLSVNGFTLSKFAVRVFDDSGPFRLPEDQLPTEETHEGEDEIIVEGKKRRRIPGAAHFWLMIGGDDLKRCSSLTYNKNSRRLSLNCSLTGV